MILFLQPQTQKVLYMAGSIISLGWIKSLIAVSVVSASLGTAAIATGAITLKDSQPGQKQHEVTAHEVSGNITDISDLQNAVPKADLEIQTAHSKAAGPSQRNQKPELKQSLKPETANLLKTAKLKGPSEFKTLQQAVVSVTPAPSSESITQKLRRQIINNVKDNKGLATEKSEYTTPDQGSQNVLADSAEASESEAQISALAKTIESQIKSVAESQLIEKTTQRSDSVMSLQGGAPIAQSASAVNVDMDGNCILNTFDFLAFQDFFLRQDPRADVDLDGVHSLFDFTSFQNQFDAHKKGDVDSILPCELFVTIHADPFGDVHLGDGSDLPPNGLIKRATDSALVVNINPNPGVKVYDILVNGESQGADVDRANNFVLDRITEHTNIKIRLAPSGNEEIFVDSQLAEACRGNYSISGRRCTGGDGDAYPTLQEASDALEAGTTILVREGVYHELGVEDQHRGLISMRIMSDGEPTAPIWIRPYEDEEVVLNGAFSVADEEWAPCSGDLCDGLATTDGVFTAAVPDSVTNFLDRGILAAFMFKNDGETVFKVASDPTTVDAKAPNRREANWHSIPADGYTTTTIKDPSVFDRFSENGLEQAFIMVHSCNNNVKTFPIADYDPATGTLTFDGDLACADWIDPSKDTYKLFNIREGLDDEDEVYIDLTDNKIFLKTSDELDNIEISALNTAIEFRGKDNVIVEGLTIKGYAGQISGLGSTAIANHNTGSISAIENIVVRDNKFYNLLGSAIGIGGTSKDNIHIDRNHVRDTVAGRAISAGGSRVIVSDNKLERVGRTGLYMPGGENHSALIGNSNIDSKGQHSNGMSTYQGNYGTLVFKNRIINSKIAWTFQASQDLLAIANVFVSDTSAPVAGWGGTVRGHSSCGITLLNNTMIGGGIPINDVYFEDEECVGVIKDNVMSARFDRPKIQNSYNVITRDSDKSLGEGEIFDPDLDKIFVSVTDHDYQVLPDSGYCTVSSTDGVVGAAGCADCDGTGVPLAIIKASDTEVGEGSQIIFNASLTKPCDGDIVEYRWDMGDGTSAKFGAEIAHAYDTANNYTVTLRATDSDGLSDEMELSILVLPASEPNIVVYYNFDGSLNDFSGYGHNACWSEGSAQCDPLEVIDGQYTAGVSGQGGLVDDGEPHILIPNLDDLRGMDEVTFSIWAKKNVADAEGAMISKHGHYAIGYSDGDLSFAIATEDGWVTVSLEDEPKDTLWHHYVMTYDGLSLKAYLDGILLGEVAGSGAITRSDATYDSWAHRLGRISVGSRPTLNAVFDEYKIYDRALDVDEVIDIYQQHRP